MKINLNLKQKRTLLYQNRVFKLYLYKYNFFLLFPEVLPYVPHTCYFGNQLCAPVMTSCEQYSRLRTCCCDKYTLEKCEYRTHDIVFSSQHKEKYLRAVYTRNGQTRNDGH